jgi:UDP-N-acetyl-D-mannosaminuronate dehydrogenase
MKYVKFLDHPPQVIGIFSTMEDLNNDSNFYDYIEEHDDSFLDQFEREWRDEELKNTDYVVPTTDHPQHSDYMAYRVALREWPSTPAFPDTRPTL